jgi:hypothetical protein
MPALPRAGDRGYAIGMGERRAVTVFGKDT